MHTTCVAGMEVTYANMHVNKMWSYIHMNK